MFIRVERAMPKSLQKHWHGWLFKYAWIGNNFHCWDLTDSACQYQLRLWLTDLRFTYYDLKKITYFDINHWFFYCSSWFLSLISFLFSLSQYLRMGIEIGSCLFFFGKIVVLVVVFSDNIPKHEPVLSYKTKVVW